MSQGRCLPRLSTTCSLCHYVNTTRGVGQGEGRGTGIGIERQLEGSGDSDSKKKVGWNQ